MSTVEFFFLQRWILNVIDEVLLHSGARISFVQYNDDQVVEVHLEDMQEDWHTLIRRVIPHNQKNGNQIASQSKSRI